MTKQPKVISQWSNEKFKAGAFVYSVEDNTVLVTKNTKSGIITIALYTYKTGEIAAESAWKMASKQAKA